jgi:hypothetical protein
VTILRKNPNAAKELIFPWKLEEYTRSKRDLTAILRNLNRLGYPLKNLERLQTNDKVVSAVTKIAEHVICSRDDVIFQNFNTGGTEPSDAEIMPWLLVLSNNQTFLKNVSSLLPVVFSLTTNSPVATTDSSELMNLFTSSRPSDDFSNDPVGDLIGEYRATGLLVWENINVQKGGCTKMQTDFHNLLNFRTSYQKRTVFTAQYRGSLGAKVVAQIMGEIVSNYGEPVAGLVEEGATVMNFTMEKRSMRVIDAGV